MVAIAAAKQTHARDAPISRMQKKPLLCVTYISFRNFKAVNNLDRNIKYAKNNCDWIIISYKPIVDATVDIGGDGDILKSLTDAARISNSTALIIDGGNRSSTMKPTMYELLLPYLPNYEKVWLLDEDISFEGFHFDSYFSIWNCAFNRLSPLPAISQPLVKGRHLIPFDSLGWSMYNGSILAVKAAWIEQQAPILDAEFFAWFIEYFVTPIRDKIVLSETDVGHDFTWCGAARVWNDIKFERMYHNDSSHVEGSVIMNPACVLIIGDNYVTHGDYRTIVDWHHNRSDWHRNAEFLLGQYKLFFPTLFNKDSLKDKSFMASKTWYSKGSGSCRQEPVLGSISFTIVDSIEVRKTFLRISSNMFSLNTPVVEPISAPTTEPNTEIPIAFPSCSSTITPSNIPSFLFSLNPICDPSYFPTCLPTNAPSYSPTYISTYTPTLVPSCTPTKVPLYSPTYIPTCTPTLAPSYTPTNAPSYSPTYIPTYNPTLVPSCTPTNAPSYSPTYIPTCTPTLVPSCTPTNAPSYSPTYIPTCTPTLVPSCTPTNAPSYSPTYIPTCTPTLVPSCTPTNAPSYSPTYIPT
eukprot:gene36353-47316_t